MERSIAPGPAVAVYLAAIQWLVMGLFTGRTALAYSLVPLSAVTVVATESALMLRTYVDGDGRPDRSSQALALWVFLLGLLGFAVVGFLAASRSAGALDGDAWRWAEWCVTLVISAPVIGSWHYLSELGRIDSQV